MFFSWFGQACFLLKTTKNRDDIVRVVIDPFSPETGLKLPKLEAEILLVSHDHFDHNNIEAIKGEPFLIKEPGQYEIKDVFIETIPAFHDNSQGEERGKTLIFKIEAENLKLCHLGDFGQKRLTEEQLDKIGQIDVLMIPVGGIYTIDGFEAKEIINQIGPKIVIPMHYKIEKLKINLQGIENFLKAMGQGEIKPEKKLKLQTKDLPSEEEMKIILLEPF